MQDASLIPPVPQPIPTLTALRERTRDLHERVERIVEISESFASLEDYRLLIKGFYGFYKPLEDALAGPKCADAWSALNLNPADRSKAALLASDLEFLGSTSHDVDDCQLCPSHLLSVPSSAAELVGCAYVLEGATLGGQIIGKHLERRLGLLPGEAGARFFHGYGSQTGPMWQQFRRAAEDFTAREDAVRPGAATVVIDQAVAASRRTFTAMGAWLSKGNNHD